jgi:hypothetical protein
VDEVDGSPGLLLVKNEGLDWPLCADGRRSPQFGDVKDGRSKAHCFSGGVRLPRLFRPLSVEAVPFAAAIGPLCSETLLLRRSRDD